MMWKRALAVLTLVALLGITPTERAAANASLGPQTAILIQFGDGQYLVNTVKWAESMTGMELLLATGLPVLATPAGFVCRIADDGCTPPVEVCPCIGANWGYWYWAENEWKYSPVGAAGREVSAGGIDGWVFGWGKNTPPPTIEPEAIFDAARLTPGLPEIALTDGNMEVRVPYSGDVSENGNVTVQYRSVGGDWSEPPITLAREADAFVGHLANGLTPGDYEIRLTYTDPDGVNGSALWTVGVTVETEIKLYLPMLQRTAL